MRFFAKISAELGTDFETDPIMSGGVGGFSKHTHTHKHTAYSNKTKNHEKKKKVYRKQMTRQNMTP